VECSRLSFWGDFRAVSKWDSWRVQVFLAQLFSSSRNHHRGRVRLASVRRVLEATGKSFDPVSELVMGGNQAIDIRACRIRNDLAQISSSLKNHAENTPVIVRHTRSFAHARLTRIRRADEILYARPHAKREGRIKDTFGCAPEIMEKCGLLHQSGKKTAPAEG
jgi:hypothetical protein